MVRVRNLAASETERLGQRVNRIDRRAPMVNGSLSEGELHIRSGGRLVIDSDDGFTAPVATPGRDGLMPAEDRAAMLEAGVSGSSNLMLRDSSGRTEVGTPSDDEHAANKAYVDDAAGDALIVDTSAGVLITTPDGDVVSYDSGWRNVSSSLTEGGNFGVRRTANQIFYYFSGWFDSSGTGAAFMSNSLPTGWGPFAGETFLAPDSSGNSSKQHFVQVNNQSRIRWLASYDYGESEHSSDRPTDPFSFLMSFPAQDDLPVSLIGEPL